MRDQNDILCDLIDYANKFSEEDKKVLENNNSTDDELKILMDKYNLMEIFRKS